MLDYALKCYDAGLAVLPPKEDGSKAPCEPWRQYVVNRPTQAKIRGYYLKERTGIGFITGKTSGNLEVLDFDHADMFPEYIDTLKSYCPELADMLTCIESTPKGIHIYYRCEHIEGNRKLAGDEHGNVLIETRGEGGYIVAAPSCGNVNDKGIYSFLKGDHTTIPEITPEQRNELLSVASIFDRRELKTIKPIPSPVLNSKNSSNRPGDAYNAKHSWHDVLVPHGWEQIGQFGDTGLWRKPGSNSRTHHATTNHLGSDMLYIFSSAAHPFEPESTYSKFAAYTMLAHNGDYSASASELSSLGYGEKTVPTESAPWMQKEQPLDNKRGVNLADLMAMDLPPMRWVVEGLLPEGCTILAGAPKIGKSWLSLDMVLTISTPDRKLFGEYPCPHGSVLYLALEDSYTRLQDRARRIIEGLPAHHPQAAQASNKAHLVVDWAPIGKGCMEQMEYFVEHHPDTKLIIVDTLAKVRPAAGKGTNAYEVDYAVVSQFQTFALKHHLAVVLVTHLRKSSGIAGDPFEDVTGSMGISGAADATIIFKRGKNSDVADFYIRGRDVEEQCIKLKNIGGVWFFLGNESESPAHMEEIRDYIETTGQRQFTPSDFGKWYKANFGEDIKSIWTVFKRLYEAGHLRKIKNGVYAIV